MRPGRKGAGAAALALLALAVQSSLQQDAGPKQGKPFFERFRRLEEQVRRFQEVTLNRLQGIAENYNISYNIDAQFQHLTEQYRTMTSNLDSTRTSLQGDMGSLKVWMKKLQRKNKKLELKVSSLEKAMGERTKQSSRERKEQTVILTNLTQELGIHRQDLASLTSGQRELEDQLKGVREEFQGEGSRITSLEERLKQAVQNEILAPSSLSAAELANETPQGKQPAIVDPDLQDNPEPPLSALKLQTKHRQKQRLQQKYKHLVPPQAAKLLSQLRQDKAEQQELPMGAEAQASGQQGKSLQEPGDRREPLEFLAPEEPHVPALEPRALRQAEKSLQETPNAPDVLGEPPSVRRLEKSAPEQAVPAALTATRRPEEQEPPPRAQGTICNVDSMLVFPSPSLENVAIFSPGFEEAIHELSICTWVKTGATYLGTMLSYATEENDNKLVLHGRNSTNQGTIQFVIGDPAFRELPVVALLDNRWHHICIIWSSIQGKYWFYVDRRLATTGSRFQKGYELPPGGSLVLGQEQDTIGGGFDRSEAFVGSLAGFAVWNRALSPGEVSGIATGKGQPRGAILTLGDVASVGGLVQRVNCTCLEHCL
ncbi:pentraxin-4 [Lissotriton helveticus]